MEKENVLKTCYSLLRNITPLSFDCGKICDGKCCKGDDDTGMLLFPGEEYLIDSRIKIYEDGKGGKLAVCDGFCDRNKRPLSCRIYPLFPLIVKDEYGNEKIRTVFDLRGDCPIKNGDYKFNRDFCRKVKRVGELLLLNDETEKRYREISETVADIYETAEKFKIDL